MAGGCRHLTTHQCQSVPTIHVDISNIKLVLFYLQYCVTAFLIKCQELYRTETYVKVTPMKNV